MVWGWVVPVPPAPTSWNSPTSPHEVVIYICRKSQGDSLILGDHWRIYPLLDTVDGKESCTSWYGEYPIFNRVSYISGGWSDFFLRLFTAIGNSATTCVFLIFSCFGLRDFFSLQDGKYEVQLYDIDAETALREQEDWLRNSQWIAVDTCWTSIFFKSMIWL